MHCANYQNTLRDLPEGTEKATSIKGSCILRSISSVCCQLQGSLPTGLMVMHPAFLLLLFARTIKTLEVGWSNWEQWEPCTVSCGGGTQRRIRFCQTPPCIGLNNDTKECNVARCSIGFCYNLCDKYYPCQNGGSCLKEGDGLKRCYCTPDWIGPHCNTPRGEKVRQPCLTHCSRHIPCQGNGKCVKHNHGVNRCQCTNIMDFGAHCETYFRDACWGDGNYTDPLNCQAYVECVNGLPYRRSCPGDHKFNAETNQCEPPENVSCY